MAATAEQQTDIDELCINTIRTLSIDAIQKANSGHPGTPMALAPVAYLLYTRVMRHSPEHPDWPARDRFVLSAGHASMLLYSTLYLSGYGISLDDLKHFRQLGSPTAGHPEYGHAPGIETTTGPLGQGISTAVGMALAERMLAARFDEEMIAHHTYVIASDGDLEEGISSEASSLAGHLGLGRLIAFYDDNHISIEGDTALALSEDVGKRYEAYGWHVQNLHEDLDLDTMEAAVRAAQDVEDRPSLIIIRTHIAPGSPNKQDTHEAHGSPLGDEEIRLTKQAYNWPSEEPFFANLVQEDIRFHVAILTAARCGAMKNEILRLHLINRVVSGGTSVESTPVSKAEIDGDRRKALVEHEAIYEAIVKGNVAAAKNSMEHHIQEIIDVNLIRMARRMDRPPPKALSKEELSYTSGMR